MSIKFQQCPKFPFVGQTFDVELWLVNEGGKLQMRHEVPFTIKLGFEGETEASCDLLEVVSGSRKIETNGKCFLKVRLLDVSASFGDSKFVFSASPLLAEHSLVSRGVSSPMTCIRHRLVVENKAQLPTLWFKDKGGKNNCIEMVVKLSDERGLAVGRSIPLKLQLCYSSGEAVPRQNILELSRESKLQISEGFATLKVRINEVSMRHDGKCFSFLISPDTLRDPKSADISPVVCGHVEVRSKITAPKNKRGLDEEELDMNEEDESPSKRKRGENQQCLNPAPNSQNPHKQQQQVRFDLPPHNVNKLNPNNKLNNKPTNEYNSPLFPVSTPTPSSLSSLRSSSAIPTKPPLHQPSDSLPALPAMQESSEMTEHLIEWTMKALSTLDQIRWTKTGQEKLTERPLFTMSNPNKLIEDLFESYDKLSHIHPSLPVHTSCKSDSDCGLKEESCYSPNSLMMVRVESEDNNSSSSNENDFSDFGNLGHLEDAVYPENSLSLSMGIAGYL